MNTTKYALEGSLKRKETLKEKGKRNTKQFAFLVRRVMGILRARCVLFALVGKKNSNELYLVHGQSKKKTKKRTGKKRKQKQNCETLLVCFFCLIF